MTPSGVDRRGLLRGGLAGLAFGQAAALLWPEAALAAAPAAGDLLTILCDLTIPATDTPGAVATGVPAFVTLAVAHGLEGAPADAVERFEAALGAGFAKASRADQERLLGEVDAKAFARGGPPLDPPDLMLWVKLKALIVGGYYTSEIGGSKELRYELIPGRFDPDLPLAPGERAWSSDWTAVTFG